jgi:hypothetical protein
MRIINKIVFTMFILFPIVSFEIWTLNIDNLFSVDLNAQYSMIIGLF